MWLPPPHDMSAQSGKAKHVAPFSFKALKKNNTLPWFIFIN